MSNNKENIKGLRFEFLIPHLSDDYIRHLIKRNNIKKCFKLTNSAAAVFKDMLEEKVRQMPKRKWYIGFYKSIFNIV